MIKKWSTLVVIVMAFALVLVACQAEPQVVEVTRVITETVTEVVETEPETVEVEVTRVVTEVETEVVEVEPEPEPIDRTGAWVDTVVVVEEPSAEAAVNRLEVGDIDVYAFQVTNPEVARTVAESDILEVEQSFGSYNELTFNPAGPVFEGTGKLNPFAVPRVREAMNWLVDRQYIAQEIYGGLAAPRWTPFNGASNDFAALADVARSLELEYAYNPELANEVITEEMQNLGAEMVDGAWQYEGEPVEIIMLIRTEDERLPLGDYVANQLEDIGFTVIRDYKTSAEASPIWISGNPSDGQFHIYTGGWITTAVPRNLGDNFEFFYTPSGLPFPLWQAYTPSDRFAELAQQLSNNDFTTLEERREMMAEALDLALEDSVRVWLLDRASITPRRAEVKVGADLYGGISGSSLWPYTLRREGELGGSMRIAMPSILTEPWNPIAGSNWIYDTMLQRGTGEFSLNTDPFTGLNLPNRIERAEVTVQEGLPVGKTLDWVTLDFAPEITVPEDAWVDWDAAEQRFITAGEAYTETATALSRSVVYYPEDLYDTVTWHDGSPFSAADVVFGMIMTFDQAKEDSPIYDEAQVPALESFLSAFKGMRIVSVDPLVIEHYTDNFQLDAEQNVTPWWPYYDQGQGAWHNLTLGWLADAAGEAAFSSSKADANEIEWLSYIAGPTIDVLAAQLETAQADNLIPYEPTMGEFLTAEEAEARWANLAEFHRQRGHFWIGTGPFYMERAFPVEGTVILQRNADYSDPSNKWDRFAAPAIPVVELDGPGRVTIGEEAVYDIFVTFNDEPYAVDDIAEVKYLVFDATGELAFTGTADPAGDGQWQATLSADVTSEFETGSNRLEIVVVSNRVALPTFSSLEFVTAP